VAAGVDGGGVKNNAGAVTSVELASYNEGDNGAGATSGGASRYNPRESIVIGGDQGVGFDVSDGFAPAAWLTTDLGGFEIVGGAGFRNFVDNKRVGNNKITIGKGFASAELNNSFLMLQDLTGAATPNFATELRMATHGNSPWFGFRTHQSSDAAGLSNYPFLFGYGATRESCLPSETAPNCSRPMTWFPNGFWIGNSVDGARIRYGESAAGKPADSVGNPGDWLLNAKPNGADCAAWVKVSDGGGTWRCVPLVASKQSDLGRAQIASPAQPSAAGLPVCDDAHRGQYQFIPGDKGVKDSFQVCAKDASERYAWRVLY
jgi:hypothetical protein